MVLERFQRNLIELSKGDTLEEAGKEWGFLYKRERDNKDNHCICGFLIKNQYYYYNKNTKKIICCGMGCKTHIDDYGANREYNSEFRSDLNALTGNVSVGEYDLEEWCVYNEQRIYDRFFWRVDVLMTEKQLLKFSEYINEYWFELSNVEIIFDRIDEKLQAIHDREEAEAERIRAEAERIRLEAERIRQEEKDKELVRLIKIKTDERIKKEKDKEQLEVYKNELRLKSHNYRIKEQELKLMNDELINLKHKMNNIRLRLKKTECCDALFVCDCNKSISTLP